MKHVTVKELQLTIVPDWRLVVQFKDVVHCFTLPPLY